MVIYGCYNKLYPSSTIIQYIFPPQNAVLIPYLHNKSFLCKTYKKIQVLFSVLTFVVFCSGIARGKYEILIVSYIPARAD